MAFLRRSYSKIPHRRTAKITLHRGDGIPLVLRLDDIVCWEEHQHKMLKPVTLVFWNVTNSTAVLESFDEIENEVNGKAVPHGHR